MHFRDGAPGRTRTNTSVRKPDFESGASTNSATGARCGAARIKPMGGTGSTLASAPPVRFYAPPMHPYIHAQTTPDKPAYIMAGSGETVTYRQLDDQSNRIAQLFRSLGLKAGDHIALFLENNAALLRDLLGRPALGPDLHRDQLAADRGRGRLHRDRLRRPAVRHLEVSRRPGGRARAAARGRRAALHDRRHDRRLRIVGGGGRALSRDADRRRDRRPRHALFVGHHRPAQGRAAGGRAAADRLRQSAAADHPQALRHGTRTRSISRRRRSITRRRCAST